MQEKPPSCKGCVIQRRVQLFTEIAATRGRRYVTVALPVLVSSYTIQVTLDPSIEVGDKICCLLSILNSESAWRARYR